MTKIDSRSEIEIEVVRLLPIPACIFVGEVFRLLLLHLLVEHIHVNECHNCDNVFTSRKSKKADHSLYTRSITCITSIDYNATLHDRRRSIASSFRIGVATLNNPKLGYMMPDASLS